MAATVDYLKFFKTGAGMGFPVVMNNGIDWTWAMDTAEILTDDEIAIGDIIIIDLNKKADVTGDASLVVSAIVLDHTDNKALLEGHGLTVNKTSQFKSGDVVVILYLVPGLLLSMKVAASSGALLPASKVCASATAGAIRLLANSATDEPAAKLGGAMGEKSTGTGITYMPVLVGA